jgi:hypothetical protein
VQVIAVTSATTTTVLGNVKVAMLVLFSRVLFGETKDWTWQMAGGRGLPVLNLSPPPEPISLPLPPNVSHKKFSR